MDASKLRSLPPAKRFSAMQRNQDKENVNPLSDSSSNLTLPAKKRKESRHLSTPIPSEAEPPSTSTTTTTTTYCLPAKKRVWALRPDFGCTPLSPVDLNVAYKPPPTCKKDEKSGTDAKMLGGKDQDQAKVKKRKESRHCGTPIPLEAEPSITTATYCLPAKKRVWALPPDFDFKPLSPVDLNVEYKPSPPEDNEDTGTDPKVFHGKVCLKKVDQGKTEAKELLASDFSEKAHEIAHEEDKKIIEEADAQEAEDDDDGIVCAICLSTDGDPKDPIVFCDGCDLMVHSSCYGSPLTKGIPEGDWFCNQCLASPKVKNCDSFSCCLCPNKGGALKSTADGWWAHVVCALLVPEVFFRDSEGRDGIDFSKVPTRRWDMTCYICEERNGCAIDCSEPKCPLSFHVTCGLKEDLCIEYKEGKGKGAIVAGFCQAHTKLWEKQQLTGKFKIVAKDGDQ